MVVVVVVVVLVVVVVVGGGGCGVVMEVRFQLDELTLLGLARSPIARRDYLQRPHR